MDVETIKEALTKHHSSQSYAPQDRYRNVVSANGKYLGPYIPYIGKLYFGSQPRVLIYAMSQNLARAAASITRWLNRPDGGMLRQYYYPEKPSVSINPYDDGHLKIIAALILNTYPTANFRPFDNVDDKIAITNFVKFSFYRRKEDGTPLDTNPPKDIYDAMWTFYTSYEIEVLQPDLLVGVGRDTTRALKRGLRQDGKHITLVEIPFPGRLNLNSRWVPQGKRLMRTGYNPEPDKSSLNDLLQGTPDKAGLIRRDIQVDWYYFREVKKLIEEKVGSLT